MFALAHQEARTKAATGAGGKSPGNRVAATKFGLWRATDALEREADRVAAIVTGASALEAARAATPGPLDPARAASAAGAMSAPAADLPAGPGRPLDPGVEAYFAPRFGHDFSAVRVHDDGAGAASARALRAAAYTVGSHIVFNADRYRPAAEAGRELIAHELTHVVQQRAASPIPGAANRPSVSRAPVAVMRRPLGPLSPAEEDKQEEDARNRELEAQRAAWHQDQQKRIAGFLDNARRLQPDPKRGFLDPDNLVHNSAALLDAGRLTLTILSPTHYDADLHFDLRVQYPQIGGDYPADPKVRGAGLLVDAGSSFGMVLPTAAASAPLTIQSLPPKVERLPGESEPAPPQTPAPAPASASPPPPFSPGHILLFDRGIEATEDQFRNTFVHEAQHVADLSPRLPTASSWSELLDAYKSEFRAFWIQPPPPRSGDMAPEAIDSLPEAKGKADNSREVAAAHPCTICPAPDPAAKTAGKPYENHKTGMKNPRQEQIFWHIMTYYKEQQYDCCYVYNEQFHKNVDAFAFPESVNLINSVRLLDLELELRKLNGSMTRAEIAASQLAPLLVALEPLDWAFLADARLSAPFWRLLDANAPKFVRDAVKALGKKAKKGFTRADADAALAGKATR